MPGRVGALGGFGNRRPRPWLLSDARRLPDPTALLGRLPRGGVVLLRDAAPEVARRVARLSQARGLVPLVSGDGRLALALGAGLHVPDRRPCAGLLPVLLARRAGRPLPLSCAVHGRCGVARAHRLGADAALVSPAFPTESHLGAPALGPIRWAGLARSLRCPAVALGGVTPPRARRIPGMWLAGIAGIGLWFPSHSVSGKSQEGAEPSCPVAHADSIVRLGPG
ncbi:MAG: thiamine phosphate synthase [Acetobacteraceae bacterium]|nr:thiamine phosphate synthase [Acetobacteraceae bacterium]